MAKRERVPKKYLGAFKHGHRRGVRDYIDDEFSLKLLKLAELGDAKALEALEWITKYNNEVYRGVLKKNDPDAIHNTPELYKEASDGHNARRRDVMCYGKARGADNRDECVEKHLDRHPDLNHEDTVIDLLSPKAFGRAKAQLKKKSKK